MHKSQVQYFWNQIARRELLGSNRAGDASWAFKFCVQHMIYATIAQAFKQRMFELKKMIQNGERQLDALREWKQTQRMMGNVPHRRNDQVLRTTFVRTCVFFWIKYWILQWIVH